MDIIKVLIPGAQQESYRDQINYGTSMELLYIQW